MDISNQIKKRRTDMGLSQEELAERIYVSRQTISNWETDKTYPDIQSLLLLSVLFDTTIDVLVKGDLEMMEKTVASADAKKMRTLGIGMSVLLVLMIPFALAGIALWGTLGSSAGIGSLGRIDGGSRSTRAHKNRKRCADVSRDTGIRKRAKP